MLVVKMTDIKLNLQFISWPLFSLGDTEQKIEISWMNHESLLVTELVKDGKKTRAIS